LTAECDSGCDSWLSDQLSDLIVKSDSESDSTKRMEARGMVESMVAALFDAWARDGLADYPTIGDGGPEHVCARGAELRELIERAFAAGYAAPTGAPRSCQACGAPVDPLGRCLSNSAHRAGS
jgi:hypothetical protein